MRLRGIKLSGYSVNDGKIKKKVTHRSVSERIRQQKSKKIKPVRRTPT